MMLDRIIAPEQIARVVQSQVVQYCSRHKLAVDSVLVQYVKVCIVGVVCACMHACTCTYVYVSVYACVRIHMCVCPCVYVCVCVCVFISLLHTYILYACISICANSCTIDQYLSIFQCQVITDFPDIVLLDCNHFSATQIMYVHLHNLCTVHTP